MHICQHEGCFKQPVNGYDYCSIHLVEEHMDSNFTTPRDPNLNVERTYRLPQDPEFEEYAKWPWQQCKAVREPRSTSEVWGRCELKKGHEGDHALERGFDIPRWSTDWTD